jgi:hypothetical protein
VRETFLYTHHRWQIRSFWWYLFWLFAGGVLWATVIGIPAGDPGVLAGLDLESLPAHQGLPRPAGQQAHAGLMRHLAASCAQRHLRVPFLFPSGKESLRKG